MSFFAVDVTTVEPTHASALIFHDEDFLFIFGNKKQSRTNGLLYNV